MKRLSRPERRQLVGGALIVSGLVVAVFADPASAATPDYSVRYGVSRTTDAAGLAINWVLCAGEAPQSVDLTAHQGGSRPSAGVPVFWQIRSDKAPATEPHVERYVVGQTPAGFYETVPLRGRLPPHPTELVTIDGPSGDETLRNGMGFAVSDVPAEGIYRGTYEAVTEEQFARDGIRACGSERPGGDLLATAPVLLIVAGALLLAGPHTLLLVIGVAIVVGLAAGQQSIGQGESTAGPRQAASAFAPGAAIPPEGREVLADLGPDAPAVRELGPGFYLARFLASGDYAFVVSCDDRSIQVGELSEIPNGVTGNRQLIGCSTSAPVRSAIGTRSDRARLVEVAIVAAPASEWRVSVISGDGVVGPFGEP